MGTQLMQFAFTLAGVKDSVRDKRVKEYFTQAVITRGVRHILEVFDVR